MDQHEDALAALADPTRRMIFELLAAESRSVGEITRLVAVSQPAVSQHLSVLRNAQLVSVLKKGRTHLYRADEAGLVAIRRYLDAMWTDVFDRYRRSAEEEDHEQSDH